jgi:FkbM family methyltransferase
MDLVTHNYNGDTIFARRNTHDFNIFNCVVPHDEYNIPLMGSDSLVVDVGAHIGSFSYLALKRGAERIYSFEAHPENFAVACKNLEQFGNKVTIRNRGVWRSDIDLQDEFLYNDSLENRTDMNTGGLSVLWNNEGIPVPMVSLDSILKEVTDDGKRHVNLMKVDCEGSEYPILLTCNKLDLVDAICGEYHEIYNVPDRAIVAGWEPPYERTTIKKYLESRGFVVKLVPMGQNLGLFFATRE